MRRSLHHTLGVLHNAFNLVLLALVVLVISILIRDDLPVPKFIRDRIERECTARGLKVSFTHAQIDASGKILARELTVAPVRFGGPVLSAGRVFVAFDRLKLLAGRIEIVRLDAEDVRVICPASLSPTAADEPLLQVSAVTVTQHAGVWRVPGLLAAAGPLRVIAHGLIQVPAAADAPKFHLDLNRVLDQFATLAPRVVRELARLDTLEQPRLQLVFGGGTGRPLTLDALFSAAGWRDERFGEVRGVQAETHVTLRGPATTAPVRLSARLEHVARPGLVTAEAVELSAEWLAFPTAKNFLPWQVHVAAANVQHAKGRVTAPVLAVFPLAYPLVDVTASAVLEGEALALAAEADVRRRSGIVTLRGGAGATWLARASEILRRDVTYYATIATPPDVSVQVTIDDGLQLRGADFRVITPPLVARRVALDRARVHGHVDRAGLRIDHLEFTRGDEFGHGTYQSDFKSRDYRFMITGAMRPDHIATWYGPWWAKFWKDYQFHGGPPRFNLDAHGNWLRPEPILMTGAGAAENITIRDVPLEAVRTRLFVRPGYFDLFDATILRPEGRIDGDARLRFVRGDPLPVWQELRFSSNADLVAMARVFGPGGDALLAPYRYTIPPNLTLAGTVAREGREYDVNLELGLNTGDEFRYLDFPLSWLTTRASIHNRQVVLPEIYAGYAKGVLTGSARTDAGRLTFDAKLLNADFDLAMKIYSDFVDRNFPTPPEKLEPGSIVRDSFGGTLTLNLAAQGPIADLKAYEGAGDLVLSGAKLYQLNVIGVFSDLFGTGIGTFGFTDAKGAFEVRRDLVHFPNLRVTGNTARLDATGSYSLADRSINFRVRMEALRESRGFITKLLGLVVNPLTNLLFEARLTGTLRNPKRAMDFLAPRAPEPEPEPPPPVAPAPATTPAPASTSAPVETSPVENGPGAVPAVEPK